MLQLDVQSGTPVPRFVGETLAAPGHKREILEGLDARASRAKVGSTSETWPQRPDNTGPRGSFDRRVRGRERASQGVARGGYRLVATTGTGAIV